MNIETTITKGDICNVLYVYVNREVAARYFYRDEEFTEEYVRGTIAINLLRDWFDNEIDKFVSASQESSRQRQQNTASPARCCRCKTGRCDSKISQPEQPSS